MSSVDVIVPCYRYGMFLRECVESVLSQDFENLRVLIIDDASPDNTSEIAEVLMKDDARVTFIRTIIEASQPGRPWSLNRRDPERVSVVFPISVRAETGNRETGSTHGSTHNMVRFATEHRNGSSPMR